MKLVTAEEMFNIEKRTIEEFGIPAQVLMALAGRETANYIIENYQQAYSISIFCGQGNNGGDGFVTAYMLHNCGRSVKIIFIGEEAKLSVEANVFYNACKKSSIPIITVDEPNYCDFAFTHCDLIVDALIGIGCKGALRGIISNVVTAINSSRLPIVSIDIPSGLPSEGMGPDGEAIIADSTVTFGLPKLSLVTMPGKIFTGKLAVADIAFPPQLLESNEIKANLIDENWINDLRVNEINVDAHKGERGHLLLIGGFDGMEGAIMLTALAALQTGVGLITLMTTPEARKIIAGKIPELITIELSDDSEKIKSLMQARRYDSLVIGPGMGRLEYSVKIFKNVISLLDETQISKVIMDADALSFYPEIKNEIVLPKNVEFLLTPHFNEASKILNKSITEIKNDRLKTAMELAKISGLNILLKGPYSIITDGINININSTGNPLLATAGSGDVLSGIIGALSLQDMPLLTAATLAVYLHGLSADLHKHNKGITLKARDIIDNIVKSIEYIKS